MFFDELVKESAAIPSFFKLKGFIGAWTNLIVWKWAPKEFPSTRLESFPWALPQYPFLNAHRPDAYFKSPLIVLRYLCHGNPQLVLLGFLCIKVPGAQLCFILCRLRKIFSKQTTRREQQNPSVLSSPDCYYYKRQGEHKFALFLLELMHEYLSQHKYVPP